MSFTNLRQLDLPDFDFVVLHGIYSWVSEDLRRDIIDFLERKLRPGGLCFVSYNCTISRGSDLAFRQLLQASLYREGTPSPEGITRALGLAEELAGMGARYFTNNTATMDRLKDAKKRSPTYVFHEYFNPIWKPFFFHEVAAQMTPAKLNFIGDTSVAWNNPDLCVPSSMRPLLERYPSSAERELLKGIWTNQAFRRDVYIKGPPQRLSLNEQVQMIRRLHFGLMRPRAECLMKVGVPAGIVTLPEKPFTALLDALQNSPVSGETLRKLLPDGQAGDTDFVRAMIVLLGVEHAELRTSPQSLVAVEQRFNQFNAGVARCVDRSQNLFIAATAKNGLAIQLGDISYFLYRAHQTGSENRVSKAYRLLRTSGRTAHHDGKEIKDRNAAETLFAEADSNFVRRVLPRL